MDHLFCYGSLRPGASHTHLLEKVPGYWSKAFIKAEFHDRGWSEGNGYPGLVLDDHADWLEGDVYSSNDFGQLWASLDEWEGEEYIRVPATVKRFDGSYFNAQVYVLNLQQD
ncbi:gamma-glutamylcyclotransferase [Rhodobacteraceae bacterium RKSG542]|uniref:gamma-glutamylcyclotransferase family protein n=1 Tax=Pseudovibrio flavus TaxID=2529854 RepID=UPI0012BC0F62|nr:gamma-glutamylcyclotransferase family protein [Pseudovibrio flavus]MTI16081.1 gamma-glutamylcyclotransferase [Pseudovibrio flavus]